MSTATVTVKEVKDRPSGTKIPWKLIDGNDTEFITFNPDLIAPARDRVGQKVEVEYEEQRTERDDRVYLNNKLLKVKPVDPEPETPPLGTGQYVKGKTAPTDQRSIWSCQALEFAARVYAGKGAETDRQQLIYLADAMFVWLLRTNRALNDEDIPFMDEYQGGNHVEQGRGTGG